MKRSTTRPSYLIVTTMKNEGAFMLEWIAYNRVIGFTDFVIFTNDCDDGTDKIAMRLEKLGYATHEPNPLKPGDSPQRKALRRARWHPCVQAADWLMCADADEFLNIRLENGNLNTLMARLGNIDAVSFCWKLFGNSGRIDFEPGFVTEQFTHAAPERRFPDYRAKGVKTLFRNGCFNRFGVHRPRVDQELGASRWVDAGGQPVTKAFVEKGWSAYRGFRHDFARLHHYAVRSVDSFLVKRDRGRTNHINMDQGIDYWQGLNCNNFEDASILSHLEPVRAEYQRLLQDKELASLHDTACNWHKAKTAELRKRDGWNEFRDTISGIVGGLPEKREARRE